MTESDFDRCFNVNVKGIFWGIQAVIPRLLEQKRGGSIINIASVGANRPRPGLVFYNSSKAAVANVRISPSPGFHGSFGFLETSLANTNRPC